MKLKDGFVGERTLVLPKIIIDQAVDDPLLAALYITDIGYYPRASHHSANGWSLSGNMCSSIVWRGTGA